MNGRDTEPKRNPTNSFVGGCQGGFNEDKGMGGEE
jgi:hypothetical protein